MEHPAHLRRGDKILLTSFALLWATCFGLSVRTILRPSGFPSVSVLAPRSSGDYPTFRGFASYAPRDPKFDPEKKQLVGFLPWGEGDAPDLQIGDRIIRAGRVDLKGAGPLAFFSAIAAQSSPDLKVLLLVERGRVRREVALPVVPYALAWTFLPASLGFALSGVFLFLKGWMSKPGRAASIASFCFAVQLSSLIAETPGVTYAAIAVTALFGSLALFYGIKFWVNLPEDAASKSLWARILPWPFLVFGLLTANTLTGFPLSFDIAPSLFFGVIAASLVVAIAVTARNYRYAGPEGRRQIKWVIYGHWLAAIPLLAGAAIALANPLYTRPFRLSVVALLFIPLSFVIAIVRYNFLDIDRLISATASYNILAGLLLGAVLLVVPRGAAAGAHLLGIDPTVGQVALSVVLATLVIPAHRRLRPQIERVFFPERYAVDQGIERLLDELSACTYSGAPELVTLTGQQLDALLRPQSCAIYVKAGDVFSPMFVRGGARPADTFQAQNPLIASLQLHAAPMAAESWSARRPGVGLSYFDRAALETLDVAVIVPIRSARELVAFVCLGPKHSGDVYTPTDLALFAAIAEKLSGELRRLESAGEGTEEILRDVPGSPVVHTTGLSTIPGHRLLPVLGMGAMGVVYRAEQLDARGGPLREVAIKMIRPELSADEAFRDRFLQEIRVAATLRSPHVVTVYGCGMTQAQQLYYSMELVRGPTLKELLKRPGPLPVERVLDIARQVCEALADVHSLSGGVVHRDLKPGNVFVEERQGQDHVKVTDFGVAKLLGGDQTVPSVVGTPQYMAPEQWLGQRVDGRTDLYALGVMMYEMLTGRAPFQSSRDGAALMHQHLHERPAALRSSVPESVRTLVEQLLAKSLDARPPDAPTVRRQLEAARGIHAPVTNVAQR